MTLIPWIVEGDNYTVVTNHADFRVDGKAIWITDIDKTQFKEGNTNSSYDLRAGSKYINYRDGKEKNFDKALKISPNKAAIIETKEKVYFPESVFGLIIPKESMLRDGISIPPTKVDPGYPGQGQPGCLHITVFNHGTKSFKIDRNDAFCALCLFQVINNKGIIPYSQGEKKLESIPKKPSFWPDIFGWVTKNILFILIALAAVGGLVLSIIDKVVQNR